MRLLVDTHAFLWFLANDPQLSPLAKSSLEEPTNELVLSVASPWEIAIKVSLGKLSIPGDIETFIKHHMALNDIELLDIRLRHVARVSDLPFHHRDPFDRLMIAQALVEDIPILSQDVVFDAYGIKRIG
ncbi:type II toxin-antitoxin system VapC family toxin [Sorangium sp. So ce1389]|uniref:type II toxin-antitoxin system VapC family toxin n=1 Tax=Sorangium sp. So ce1389 TaxID=3133336 RepID=UPI003F5FECD8